MEFPPWSKESFDQHRDRKEMKEKPDKVCGYSPDVPKSSVVVPSKIRRKERDEFHEDIIAKIV